jgi:nucleoside phosphorylase
VYPHYACANRIEVGLAVGFSDLLAAVTPKKRSEQYIILAAMYDLLADSQPSAVAEINKLIKLHVTKNLPANVSARLKEYPAYVEPVASSTPKRWRLKSAGIEKLEAISGKQLKRQSEKNDFGIDVGIICALEQPEFEAVRDALGGPAAWQRVGDARYSHIYRETVLRTTSGEDLKVVATVATSMGLTAAAIVTSQMIAQFRPRLVVMTGIAAGTRSSNKQFGDVLVADPSVDYSSGKVVAEEGIRAFLPDPYPIGLKPRLRTILRRYASDPQVFERIRGRWRGRTPAAPNRAHIGPLGAADQVVDNQQAVVEIQRNWRKLIGVEMETYAVYRACDESPEPQPRFVSFKAVCDFAAEKTDSWQAYAAFMAAHFAVDFLKSEWDALWGNE